MDSELNTVTATITGQHGAQSTPFTFVQSIDGRLITSNTSELVEFVSKLVQPGHTESLKGEHDAASAARELGFTKLDIAYQIDGENREKVIL
jgi:hypothetical protein